MIRREMIKCGVAAALVGGMKAFALPTRSAVAARHILGGGAPWTNPYITDGLVAMWDGVWNCGGGEHDANATVWKDLVGSRDATLSGSYSWGNNYWDVQSVSGHGLARWDATNLGNSQTIEFVIMPIALSLYGRIISEGQAVASPNLDTNENSIRMYGYGIDSTKRVSSDFQASAIHSHQITHPSGGPMRYYIDGSLVWEAQTSQDSTGAEYGYFANRPDYTRGLDARYFTMRRYNRVLTEEELSANYAIDKARFNLP